MSLPSSDYSLSSATGSQQASRGRGLARLSVVFGIATLVASAAWGPVMQIIAYAIRPAQISTSRLSYQEAAPFQHEAEQRMWIILIVSFLVILTLVALAILFGRRALRIAGNDVLVARLRRWGAICLAISLLSLACAALLLYGPVAYWLNNTFSYIYTISRFILAVLASTMAMGVLASIILTVITVRGAAIWAWLNLLVSMLVVLLWFFTVAFLARFIAAFYLHLVW